MPDSVAFGISASKDTLLRIYITSVSCTPAVTPCLAHSRDSTGFVLSEAAECREYPAVEVNALFSGIGPKFDSASKFVFKADGVDSGEENTRHSSLDFD